MRNELFTQQSTKVVIEETSDELLVIGHPKRILPFILLTMIVIFGSIFLPYFIIPFFAPEKIRDFSNTSLFFVPPGVTILITLLLVSHKEYFKYFSLLRLNAQSKEVFVVWEGIFTNRKESFRFDDIQNFQQAYAPAIGKHSENWWLEIKLKDSRIVPLVYVFVRENANEAVVTTNNFLQRHGLKQGF